jgi:hypothetical protein
MMRWLLRYGAIRLVGRRALPVLMVWDAAVLANKARQIPVVDKTLRRGAAAAADRFADTLDNVGPRFRPTPGPDEAPPPSDGGRGARGARGGRGGPGKRDSASQP